MEEEFIEYLKRTERPEQSVRRIGCTIILTYFAIVGSTLGAVKIYELYNKKIAEDKIEEIKLEKRLTPDFSDGLFFD